MKQKIQAMLADMNTGLIDREQAIKAALLSVLAAENLVLIGPPGTAKSMVSRRVAQHIQATQGSQSPHGGSGSYFEYLLTKFSTPEEIFGPLSISELKADRFRRNTAGYLPTAEIAFLDEIFKSSSSILNALLTILNERVFHNGNQPQHVPLRSLISASNELPSGQEELSALYDRFLMRCFVGPVREEHLLRLFETTAVVYQPTWLLTVQDFQAVDAAAQQVRIPPTVGEAIRGIWAAHKEAFKEDRREYLSDRRLVKLLKLLRVSAATNQRTEVDLSDAMLLQHCLWNHPDNMDKVREIVITTLQRHSEMVPVDDEDTDLDVYVVGGDGKQLVQQPRQTPKPATTGSQLAVVSSNQALAARGNALSVSPMRSLPPTRTRTKGFMGSGTAQDPLRIANAEDLISLDDPDISLAGYHFVQTDDIDCSAISHWPSFEFKGHYDGRGKCISKLSGGNAGVFRRIQATSSVVHLRLEACALAQTAEKSSIKNCQVHAAHLLGEASEVQVTDCQVSGASLVTGNASSTKITHCQVTGGGLVVGDASSTQITDCQVTGGNLVTGNATSTQITDCQVTGGSLVKWGVTSTQITDCQVGGGAVVEGDARESRIIRCGVSDGLPLVVGAAFKTQIEDCSVVLDWSPSMCGQYIGPIARWLADGCVVERCFAAGRCDATADAIAFTFVGPRDVYFGGIVGEGHNSAIRHCAVGSIELLVRFSKEIKRIVHAKTSLQLQNNASIDTNPGQDEPDGPDGKTVAAARFNQRFFEGSLGWDFDTVWQWDAANNRPALRFAAPAPQASEAGPAATLDTAASGKPLEDLLTRQVQANIWL